MRFDVKSDSARLFSNAPKAFTSIVEAVGNLTFEKVVVRFFVVASAAVVGVVTGRTGVLELVLVVAIVLERVVVVASARVVGNKPIVVVVVSGKNGVLELALVENVPMEVSVVVLIVLE